MGRKLKPKYERTRKNICLSVLFTAAALIALGCFSPTRAFLTGVFGYAFYAYIPAMIIFAVLLTAGKRITVTAKRAAVYISLLILIICTLHIGLAKELIESVGGVKGYITEPYARAFAEGGSATVGGLSASLLTCLIFLAVGGDYSILLTVVFIATAAAGFFAIYPLLFKMDSKKRVKEKVLPPETNPIKTPDYTDGGLYMGETEAVTAVSEPITEAETLLFGKKKMPSEPCSQELFSVLTSKENDPAASAEILFTNKKPEPVKEKPVKESPKYGALDALGSDDGINLLYTNQQRMRAMKDNLDKPPRSDYDERYGNIPVYGAGDYTPRASEPQIKEPQISTYSEPRAYRPEPVAEPKPSIFDYPEHVVPVEKNFDKASALKFINTPLTPDELVESTPFSPMGADRAADEIVAAVTPAERCRETAERSFDAVKPVPERVPAKPVQQSMFGEGAPKTAKRSKPYKAPPIELLKDIRGSGVDFPLDYEEVKAKIEITMEEFKIPAHVISARKGPTVSLYELELGPGYPINKILGFKENLKMRLQVKNLTIHAPLAGRDAFGIEIPNPKRDVVGLRSFITSREFNEKSGGLWLPFGKSLFGDNFVANLADMPHLLVAGATGTGKSVFLNSLITSILFKYSPEDVRFILIDPKRVEMAIYHGLPHMLLKDTVKEPQQAVNVLRWITEEMDRRYKFLEKVGCPNIQQYNDFVRKPDEPRVYRIILVVDEMADLMMRAKKQVEDYIVRIAQLARACGIHMIIATQRPTKEIITGLIKSNIIHRVAFQVKSSLDSRVIFDEMGAEDLLGKGDMYYSYPANLSRMQAPLIETDEIFKVCEYVRENNESNYDEDIYKEITYVPPQPESPEERTASVQQEREADFETLLRRILKSFIIDKRASVSSAQTKFNIGYIKAKKIVDAMSARGFLGPEDGAKPRDIFITLDEFYEQFGDSDD